MIKCNQKSAEKIKTTILRKYSYLGDDEVDMLFDRAVGDYLRLKYPSMNNSISKDTLVYDFTISQWIVDRIIDIVERAGASNLTSYRENGLSFSFGSSYIDPELRKQIMPRVGVPK